MNPNIQIALSHLDSAEETLNEIKDAPYHDTRLATIAEMHVRIAEGYLYATDVEANQ